MKLLTLNEKNKVIHIIENDDQYIMNTLLKQLWSKQIQKTKHVKRIDYKYNYSDKQTIKITFDNKLKYVFEDIPTIHGCINTDIK